MVREQMQNPINGMVDEAEEASAANDRNQIRRTERGIPA
jgi:hypothetical protein